MKKVFVSLTCLLVAAIACATGQAVEKPLTAEQEKGKAVFQVWCSGCHEPTEKVMGPPPAGTFKLRQKYKDTQPALLEERKDLTPSLIKYFVRNGGFIMTPFRKTEIGDSDIDALSSYLCRDPKGLERAAEDVDTGKVPSRLGRDLPLVFTLPAPGPADPQVTGLTEQQSKGRALFEKGCNYCHAVGRFGTLTLARRLQELNKKFDELPPEVRAKMPPAKRVNASDAELVKRDNLAPDYVLCVVRHGVKEMPQYPPLEISHVEIDAISAFLTRSNPVVLAPVARGDDCQPLEQQSADGK